MHVIYLFTRTCNRLTILISNFLSDSPSIQIFSELVSLIIIIFYLLLYMVCRTQSRKVNSMCRETVFMPGNGNIFFWGGIESTQSGVELIWVLLFLWLLLMHYWLCFSLIQPCVQRGDCLQDDFFKCCCSILRGN